MVWIPDIAYSDLLDVCRRSLLSAVSTGNSKIKQARRCYIIGCMYGEYKARVIIWIQQLPGLIKSRVHTFPSISTTSGSGACKHLGKVSLLWSWMFWRWLDTDSHMSFRKLESGGDCPTVQWKWLVMLLIQLANFRNGDSVETWASFFFIPMADTHIHFQPVAAKLLIVYSGKSLQHAIRSSIFYLVRFLKWNLGWARAVRKYFLSVRVE